MKHLIIASMLLAVATPAFAQDATESSHWGVSGSFVPQWVFLDPLAQIMDIETNVKGIEYRAGIVRGRDAGGDWGFSVVRRHVRDGSFVQLSQTACVTAAASPVCTRGAYHVTRDARLLGVEAHKYFVFGTIANRVQIGITIAGGAGKLDGTSDHFIEHLQVSNGTLAPSTVAIGSAPFRETIKQLEIIPLGRTELTVGVMAAPGLKVKVSGGFNFPGYQSVSAQVQYLFGAR